MSIIGLSFDYEELVSYTYPSSVDLSTLSIKERLEYYGATIEYTDHPADLAADEHIICIKQITKEL